jgi:hypothetical protein
VEGAREFAKFLEEKDPNILMFSISRSHHAEDPSAPEEVAVAVTYEALTQLHIGSDGS